MSASLQWAIIRNNSSFLVKNGKAILSREANNLTNENSFKASGLVNERTVGVAAGKDGKGVVLSIRNKGAARKPAKALRHVALKRNARRTLAAIRNETTNNHYREDLTRAALARASAILRSQQPKKAVVAKKRSHKARK